MARNSLPSTDKVADSGSLTVFIDFSGGTTVGVTIDSIHAAIAKAVADLTGTTDVKVLNRGAALILKRGADSAVAIAPSPAMRAAMMGGAL